MGTLWNKIDYLLESINDIQAAINEKKIKVDNTVPLGQYGEKIRAIETGGMWADYISIEAVPAYTEEDLVAEEYSDVTEKLILGEIEGTKSRDYLNVNSVSAYTEDDLIACPVEDVTNTITIIEKTYTGNS